MDESKLKNEIRIEPKNQVLEFNIEPPMLTPWLGDEDRESNILLLDLQIDLTKENSLRFDFDLAFNPIAVRRGVVVRRDFYVGCTGAELFFRLKKGNVVDYTRGSTLNVDYKNEKEFVRNSSLNLSPQLTSKHDKNEISANLGSIKHDKSKKVAFSANFQNGERTLEPTHFGDSVRWQISLPRGLKVVRDYLLGNLYLSATCEINEEKKEGVIKVKPSDVLFFDASKSPLNRNKSILMRYILYREGIDINNADGFEIHFNQIHNEES